MSKIKIPTTRFGEVEVDHASIYTFPDGLLGFTPVKQYFVLANPSGKGPFQWLHAVEPPSLAFIICNPATFKPDYRVKVKKEDLASIKLENLEDALVYVIMVIPKDPKLMTANLQGPLVLNPKEMLAKQLVLQGDEYTTKHRVFGESATAGQSETK